MQHCNIKSITTLLLAIITGLSASIAQKGVNYDETKVPPYTLPELMQTTTGIPVTSAAQWEKLRRPELLALFAAKVYGRTPSEKIHVNYALLQEDKHALHGKATSRQVRLTFSNGQKQLEALLLLYLPNGVKGKVPVFVSYNFKGNHSLTTDTSIRYSYNFPLVRKPDHPDWQRGSQSGRWPVEKIISNGYALATMCYHDIFPDAPGLKDHSIVSLFADYNKGPQQPDEWQAIGAWAWGSSRIADYLETVTEIDSRNMIIMGHSRQGKAALWAGAQDKRFSIVISNDSGAGGAALSKRTFGETIDIVTNIKPAWFCPAFDQFKNNEQELPVDQHELIALMAPRPVYIASAKEDLWADPKGEYLAAYFAGPVYTLYGLRGLPSKEPPLVNQPAMYDVGYHIRTGVHDVTDFDWTAFIRFSNMHLKGNSKP
ncbi:hypothetical protein [Niabella sp.]|uniref:glucuronyl esterase domain-containing protein n=1 Tax=Niabella sp. TaxID=1962976 RepID=UPI00261C2629|nr:hypothetical protein [Niabella sp.]